MNKSVKNSLPPILSIVIQNYNYGHFIADALDSLASQTYENFEVIVIDDGSSDNSIDIIEGYRHKFKNFDLIAYPKNKGIHYSINHSLYIARGEYIHWLAADDFREKNFVEETMGVLLKNPSIPFCCSDFGYTDEKSGRFTLLSKKLLNNTFAPLVLEPISLIPLMSKSEFWIPTHTTIIKRDSIIKYGGFKQELLEKCDWYLFHLIALKEGVIYLPKPLSYIYCHSTSYGARVMSNKILRRKSANAVMHNLRADKEIFSLFLRSTALKVILMQNPFILLNSFKSWLIFYYCLNSHHIKKLLRKFGFE